MGSVNRKDLQSLAHARLAEARALLSAGHSDGAYYLAGYAVECALKACTAKSTQRHDFPEKKSVDASYTHDLNALIKVANLEAARVEEARKDPAFRNYWDVVRQWSEHSRYGRHTPEMADALIEAISSKRHGLIVWIKRYW